MFLSNKLSCIRLIDGNGGNFTEETKSGSLFQNLSQQVGKKFGKTIRKDINDLPFISVTNLL